MEYLPGEIAQQLGIAPATLRLWSNKFSEFLSAGAGNRDGAKRSQRRYSEEDLDRLTRIKDLLGQGKTYNQALRHFKEALKAAAPEADSSNSTLKTLFSGLEERLSGLPRKQTRLAQAMLKTPEIFVFGSVREISSQLNVNIATIVRFAQILGYSGYQALQTDIRRAYLEQAGLNPPRDPATVLENSDRAIQATLARHQSNLQQAHQNLTQIDLDKICDVIIKARRILVWADGSPVVVGTLLIRLLRHIGLKGELVPPSGVDTLISMYDLGPEDVVIGIGLWLTFKGVVDALNLARRKGAQTIALTGSPTSPLIKAADHVIIAPSQGAAISFSVVSQIAVVELIIASIAARRPQKTIQIQQALHDLYLEESQVATLMD